ncbi:hypothetical protein RLIN73S_04963 [Rhodanobacter lindaniclasticus]
MGQDITIPTGGTHCIGAYLARPEGKPRGGLVVIQEIFGVTAHIRSGSTASPRRVTPRSHRPSSTIWKAAWSWPTTRSARTRASSW